jgi:catechol 2,3-dioxygenase-like lactoylglutathione lyase family enzyme
VSRFRLLLLLSSLVSFEGCHCPGEKPTDKPDKLADKSEASAAAPNEEALGPTADLRSTLLGGERGLDHVGVGVRSLEHAAHTYQEVLGFSRPIEGKLGNGLQNANYYFANATYLETIVAVDREKGKWIADFTDKHPGGVFAVLSVFSPEDTTKFLAARGIKAGSPIPGRIQTPDQDAAPEEQWKTFSLPQKLLPGDPFFFISYKREGQDGRDEFLRKIEQPEIKQRFRHKNTALGLRAVWLAVEDLGAATAAYESIGLAKGRTFDDAALGAKVQSFPAGIGEIWLMGKASADGKIAAFLEERKGPGVLGVTIEVASVGQAARVIGQPPGVSAAPYEGALGQSIRVSPELAEGVWIEFTHSRPANSARDIQPPTHP